MGSPGPTDVAQRFAVALDEDRWDAVAACLAADCEYVCRGVTMRGPAQIVASYRTIGEWVVATFESVRYESAVEAIDDDRALISFRDLLDHQGHHLDFRCQQVVTLGPEHTIVHIEHVDLPGEPEKVVRFNAACGVEKPRGT